MDIPAPGNQALPGYAVTCNRESLSAPEGSIGQLLPGNLATHFLFGFAAVDAEPAALALRLRQGARVDRARCPPRARRPRIVRERRPDASVLEVPGAPVLADATGAARAIAPAAITAAAIPIALRTVMICLPTQLPFRTDS